MNANVIIARYGEVHLKGNNRGMFMQRLTKNLRDAVGKDCKIELKNGRYIFTEFEQDKWCALLDRIAKVFGLTSVSPCVAVPHDQILRVMEDEQINGAFRVNVNRADKKFPHTSMEFAAICGATILKKCKNAKVDLYDPDDIIFVDIREDNIAYVYGEVNPAVGGLPVGTAGRALVLLSGGIDSPVAAWLASKRGLAVDFIHFSSPPYTSDMAMDKVRRLAGALEPYCGKSRLFTVPVTQILQQINALCVDEYTITILRRFMVRIAREIAEQNGHDCIVTGENLAQVASQTIQGITTNNVLAGATPILRPLITYDKSEIIALAQKIGTYGISVEPHQDCCTVFVPSSPVISPTIAKCEKQEQKLEINALVKKAIQDME
ncbi:MAG: tRNA 4-thiouridine(8) synthase ThiI [Christensenellaceae bacterium]|jgi:thiamine biosynthesis protein ThiI|nr:tRNA 4-thiouridine(8) synthase ThiI [Christensenellaceae bacterium]